MSQDVLDLALLILEMPPVRFPISGLFATHQNVLPLLNLDLELEVGLIEELLRMQGAVQQTAICLNTAGEEMKTSQCS
ncbi:hypothetical protein [Pseudomonas sp. JV449]|uniref:hypothetical protein n=1 Tax=Pseudomonas sp. JV449 TaxID=1890658 RepID=UPI003965845D